MPVKSLKRRGCFIKRLPSAIAVAHHCDGCMCLCACVCVCVCVCVRQCVGGYVSSDGTLRAFVNLKGDKISFIFLPRNHLMKATSERITWQEFCPWPHRLYTVEIEKGNEKSCAAGLLVFNKSSSQPPLCYLLLLERERERESPPRDCLCTIISYERGWVLGWTLY